MTTGPKRRRSEGAPAKLFKGLSRRAINRRRKSAPVKLSKRLSTNRLGTFGTKLNILRRNKKNIGIISSSKLSGVLPKNFGVNNISSKIYTSEGISKQYQAHFWRENTGIKILIDKFRENSDQEDTRAEIIADIERITKKQDVFQDGKTLPLEILINVDNDQGRQRAESFVHKLVEDINQFSQDINPVSKFMKLSNSSFLENGGQTLYFTLSRRPSTVFEKVDLGTIAKDYRIFGDAIPSRGDTRKAPKAVLEEADGKFKVTLKERASEGFYEFRSVRAGEYTAGKIWRDKEDERVYSDPKYFRNKYYLSNVKIKDQIFTQKDVHYKIRYIISDDQEKRIADMEREHLDDYEKAFDLSLVALEKAYLALKDRSFNSPEEAIDAPKKEVHPRLVPKYNLSNLDSWGKRALETQEQLIGLSRRRDEGGADAPHAPLPANWEFDSEKREAVLRLRMKEDHQSLDGLISLDNLKEEKVENSWLRNSEIGDEINLKFANFELSYKGNNFNDDIKKEFSGKLLRIREDGKPILEVRKDVLPGWIQERVDSKVDKVEILITSSRSTHDSVLVNDESDTEEDNTKDADLIDADLLEFIQNQPVESTVNEGSNISLESTDDFFDNLPIESVNDEEFA